MKKEMIKPFIWGFIAGAVVLLIVIFWTGFAVTKSSAEQQAEEMAEEAVVDKLATICVAQFEQDPEKEKKRKELEDTASYQRGDYVKKQGWANMPGIKEPDSSVCDECAERILKASK
ncbi:MAG: hypothetical protein JRK26_19115 [Deltaproteobacteria bacterium]|nr:hypothetical protein [Deltaproteobacteria bacterium]MBW1994697.1 hypothetical protein [Deltaproteobacteria bacterium]